MEGECEFEVCFFFFRSLGEGRECSLFKLGHLASGGKKKNQSYVI